MPFANGGIYNEPSLIKGFIEEDENFTEINKKTSKRVLKTETCDILKEYLLNNGPLPVEKIVDFAGQISSALEHAHAKKIIQFLYHTGVIGLQ